MEELLANTDVVIILVSSGLAFALGWLWYSPLLFLQPWSEGLGLNIEASKAAMAKPMMLQSLGTLMLALVTNIAASKESIILAAGVGFTVALFVMASSFYRTPKSAPALIEGGYIFAMVLLMLMVNIVM